MKTTATGIENALLNAEPLTVNETARELSRDELPAGGNDPSRFDWQEAWYPVYYIQDLDSSKPTRFTLLNRDLVLWWDKAANSWIAFEDRCPHRLAPLSEGRINEAGLLECPYHGWTFAGTGRCQSIPQQREDGQAHQSQRACVASLPTTVKQGLLFVYAGKPENAPKVKVPIVEPLAENSQEWVCIDTFRDLPYDALTLLENVLDSSHLPFTHHRSVGNRANAAPVDLEIVESGRQGFQGKWEEGPRRGTLGSQQTTFIAPGLMWHDLTSKQFGRTLTVVYATPIRQGECRLFARFPFKFSSKLPGLFIKLTPRWFSHIGQNSVLEDDQIFLHYQERYLEQLGGSANFAKAFYLPTQADRFVVELRQWVNHYHAEPFSGSKLAPSLSREYLLDRYQSHTQKCVSCRTATANIQRLKLVLAVVGALCWAITSLVALTWNTSAILAVTILTAIVLLCGGMWLGLSWLEQQFYRGRGVPLRNVPEKKPLI